MRILPETTHPSGEFVAAPTTDWSSGCDVFLIRKRILLILRSFSLDDPANWTCSDIVAGAIAAFPMEQLTPRCARSINIEAELGGFLRDNRDRRSRVDGSGLKPINEIAEVHGY